MAGPHTRIIVIAAVALGFAVAPRSPADRSNKPVQRSGDSSDVERAVELQRQRVISAVESVRTRECAFLARQLRSRRVDVREALRQLVAVLPYMETKHKRAARAALVRVGNVSLPVLIESLEKSPPPVRLEAIEVLTQIGTPAAEAVPALMKELNKSDAPLRRAAVRALSRCGRGRKETVVALRAALSDEDELVRERAVEGLGHLGGGASAAVPRLVEMLETADDPRRRERIVRSLGRIGGPSELTIPALLSQMSHENEQLRRSAELALESMSTEGGPARRLLTARLKDPNPRVRAAAAGCLGRVASEKADVVAGLLPLLNDPEPSVRRRAMHVLGRIGPPAKAAAGKLAAALRVKDRYTRAVASQALRHIAPTVWEAASGRKAFDVTRAVAADRRSADVGPDDWPQWGGWRGRVGVSGSTSIPTRFELADTEKPLLGPGLANPRWNRGTIRPVESDNVKWVSRLGSQSYGNVVVGNGRVLVGTNNGFGYLERLPSKVDLGVLLCFDERDGRFLWQHSSPKLPTGRVHDWPLQGICATPLIDGDRAWITTNRCEIVCLDLEGFHDGENDGPYRHEQVEHVDEADVIWKFDMMGRLGVSPHNMSTCCMIAVGETLFVNTSNGIDETHVNLPAPGAPTFIAMHRDTGKVLWTDHSPNLNILHGQWASPSYAVLGGTPQVIIPGGDGWLYSFAPEGDGAGGSKLLWKFDCNPKESEWILGGRGTRNNIIAFAAVYDGLVYVAVGQDPEHGEGNGHLWCIDPTKFTDGSDVSAELAIDSKTGKTLPHRRIQAVKAWRTLISETKVGKWPRIQDQTIPEDIRRALNGAGVELPPEYKITSEDKGRSQTSIITANVAGEAKRYRVTTSWTIRRRTNVITGRLKIEQRTHEAAVPNPKSAVVWDYEKFDLNGDGEIEFEEQFHRSISTPAIQDDVLYIPDFSGLFHCLDAKTGEVYWTYDMFATCWGSALVADGKVYVGDEDGDFIVFRHSPDPEIAMLGGEPIAEMYLDTAIHSTPIVANGVLYVSTRNALYAIAYD